MRALLLCLVAIPAYGAWGNGYTYRYTLTVQPSQVTGTLSNFTSYICIDSSVNANCLTNADKELATVGNGGFCQNSSGFDVIITSDAAGATPLNYGRVIQNLTTGAALFTLLHSSITVGTTVYMFVGNSGVSTDQSNGTASWDTTAKAAHHLEESTNPYADATGNGNNSTGGTNPSLAAGFLGNGQLFNGTTQNIIFPATFLSGAPGTATYAAWFKTTATNAPAIYDARKNTGQLGCVIYVRSGNVASSYCNNVGEAFGITPVNDGNWHYLVGVLNSTTTVTTYLDGTSIATVVGVFTTWPVAGTELLGESSDAMPNFFAGTVDEVAIFSVAQSAAWVAATYNNQSNDAAFWSISAAQKNGTIVHRVISQ